jgi:hypothetical protein
VSFEILAVFMEKYIFFKQRQKSKKFKIPFEIETKIQKKLGNPKCSENLPTWRFFAQNFPSGDDTEEPRVLTMFR